MKVKNCPLIIGLATFGVVLCGTFIPVNAFIQIPPPYGGKLKETCSKILPPRATGCTIVVNVTDYRGEILVFPGFPKTEENVPPGKTVTFDIPKHNTIRDVRQTSKIKFPLPLNTQISTSDGLVSDLSIESVFFDPDLHEFVIGSIFGTLFEKSLSSVVIPDIYADTNNDGELGNGDILYSLVDLNEFTRNGIPSFTLGDSFSIVNGRIDSLPGMLFSLTPFTFTPENGFINTTPFDGKGTAYTDHEMEIVSEPSEIQALLTLGTLGAASTLKRKLKSSKSSEKETTKVS